MPNTPKTHHDMLMVFCAVCGHKKKNDQLSKISLHVASLIKTKQSSSFDLDDDRFPKVICTSCRPKLTKKNCNLPEPPPFEKIQRSALRHMALGYASDHNCFMCRSIVGGQPGHVVDQRRIVKPISKVITAKCNIEGHCLCPCPTCFQEHTGMGIKHYCVDDRGSVKEKATNTMQLAPRGAAHTQRMPAATAHD